MDQSNKVYIDPNIFYVDNFILDQEIDYLLSDVDWQLTREDPHQNIWSGILNGEQKDFHDNVINPRVKALVDTDTMKYRGTPTLTKYVPNTHCDIDNCGCGNKAFDYHYETDPGSPDLFSRCITLGVVIFLNDDFDGGELVFKHKPISVKPRRGTIIVFPGTEEYSHGVKDVIGSNRYVIANFVFSNEYWNSIAE